MACQGYIRVPIAFHTYGSSLLSLIICQVILHTLESRVLNICANFSSSKASSTNRRPIGDLLRLSLRELIVIFDSVAAKSAIAYDSTSSYSSLSRLLI